MCDTCSHKVSNGELLMILYLKYHDIMLSILGETRIT